MIPSDTEPTDLDSEAHSITTARLASIVGADDIPAPTTTEDYHEASRIYPHRRPVGGKWPASNGA